MQDGLASWIYVFDGIVSIGEYRHQKGGGVAVINESSVRLEAFAPSDLNIRTPRSSSRVTSARWSKAPTSPSAWRTRPRPLTNCPGLVPQATSNCRQQALTGAQRRAQRAGRKTQHFAAPRRAQAPNPESPAAPHLFCSNPLKMHHLALNCANSQQPRMNSG